MATKETGGPELPQARRARFLRYFLEGYDRGAQTRMAVRLEIEYNRWNNFERGSPISKDVEERLVQVIPGLTIDYIRTGARSGLSVALNAAFDQLEASELAAGRAS